MLHAPEASQAQSATHAPPQPGVERAAWAFYTIAALGSSIGQVWVGVEVPPWPDALPLWARAALVLPFAVVIDLGGAVTAAFADARMRLGETAYGWRFLSAASVTLGVGINIVGHAGSPYLSTVFGGLGVFAYSVWLLHSAARRRDALRAARMLHNTTPAYGLMQWLREPALTRRARILALEHRYGLMESLTVARTQVAAETRRAALATHIEAKIRSRHSDPILAAIAATTTPIDDIAQELIDTIDTQGWARVIGAEIQPPSHPLPRVPIPAAKKDPRDHLDDAADPTYERADGTARRRRKDDSPHQNSELNTAAEDLWIEARNNGADLSSSKLLQLFHQRYPNVERRARWAVHRRNAARARLSQEPEAARSAAS